MQLAYKQAKRRWVLDGWLVNDCGWVGKKKVREIKEEYCESFLRGSDCSAIRMQDKFFRRLHMRCRERDRNQYSDTAKFEKIHDYFFFE